MKEILFCKTKVRNKLIKIVRKIKNMRILNKEMLKRLENKIFKKVFTI